MNPLVSNQEYDLHFSDPSHHAEVSLFYLKLTDKSRQVIEQATSALSASRSQVSPSIKLEMGENLSGTITLPRIREEPSSSDGSASFAVSLEQQQKPTELLHTLVTYPTHEDRSHTPGQRKNSSASPQAPDIFLKFLGPIRHRLNIKATTGDTFASTKSHFRQINEKSKDSGAIKLTNLPGEVAPPRRNRFDLFRGRQSSHRPYQGRNSVKFPSRRPLTNGTLSPSRVSIPPQQPKLTRKLVSPPKELTPVPAPPVPKLVSPPLRKRPPQSPSPPPAPAPKRVRKESPPKKQKKHSRSSPEDILPPDTLLEISKFREQACNWTDLYPDITSADIRASYRHTYDKDFTYYQSLRQCVEVRMERMKKYEAKLRSLNSQGPEHKKIKKKATHLLHEYKELRTMYECLHDKLFVVKKQIELFDKSH